MPVKLIYGLILIGVAAIVIGGKFPAVGKHFIAKESTDSHVGDMYRLCEVDRFKEPVRSVVSSPTSPLATSDIITLGDSFFNSSLESELFANELAGKSGYAVHNMASSNFFEPYSYPLAYLKYIDFKPERRRILILETVERSSLERTTTYNSLAGTSANRLNALAFKLLKNNDVEYFFKNNLVIHPINKWLKNLRFEYFGIIDKAVGSYSVNPNMLFYQRDVEYASVPKSDIVLDDGADQVARLADILRSRYDLDLLYVVIPDKYSIYQDYLKTKNSYNMYIPRLVDKLRRRGVHAVDLYRAYKSYRQTNTDLLYFVSDTHYTARGKAILVDECLREIALMSKSNRGKDAQTMNGERQQP